MLVELSINIGSKPLVALAVAAKATDPDVNVRDIPSSVCVTLITNDAPDASDVVIPHSH